MTVETGTVATQFLFWVYLYWIFGIGSLQCPHNLLYTNPIGFRVKSLQIEYRADFLLPASLKKRKLVEFYYRVMLFCWAGVAAVSPAVPRQAAGGPVRRGQAQPIQECPQYNFFIYLFIFKNFFQHCIIWRPKIPLGRWMLGSNPGLLLLWHWKSDALTTRLDLIQLRKKVK